ncbi:hypothetical protein AAFF_G00160200 [Aldrovandia affinis]|uniref:Uncharacterized protein n=1 Tax=Aldrovandia affinis TaxID=143900 RepID=A0AAD7RN25_9TELE|nr:hypothetical protein AAFF_G00160200 [Aldrovandia affinis]
MSTPPVPLPPVPREQRLKVTTPKPQRCPGESERIYSHLLGLFWRRESSRSSLPLSLLAREISAVPHRDRGAKWSTGAERCAACEPGAWRPETVCSGHQGAPLSASSAALQRSAPLCREETNGNAGRMLMRLTAATARLSE